MPDALTNAQRAFLAQTKPPEELDDLTVDPYEVENLARNPAYQHDLERLRAALHDWQTTYGDLGLLPEVELLERWRPGGVAKSGGAGR